MRQEDVYTLEGDTMVGTIYNEECDSSPAFASFLRKAARISELLPPWWTTDMSAKCIRYGQGRNHDFSLRAAREKSDIIET